MFLKRVCQFCSLFFGTDKSNMIVGESFPKKEGGCMKVAVIGSRHAPADAARLIVGQLPATASEIISGGADGIDRAAAQVAAEQGIPLTEILPDYDRYGRAAPLKRNDAIIDRADMVLAFWDGRSKGTQYVIAECVKRGRFVRVIPLKGDAF